MQRTEIDKILNDLNQTKDRNIVIVDFGNVQKWGHIGKELYDAKLKGVISHILYAEDFEYRLNMGMFKK